MTVRPILFSPPMIRALLDGRKTQTRRLTFKAEPGDLLWVRETWQAHWGHRADDSDRPVRHGAMIRQDDGTDRPVTADNPMWVRYRADNPPHLSHLEWVSGRFMFRWASRLTLEVTEVRQEWLLEITDADAQREGIYDRHAVAGSAPTAPWTWDANTPSFARPWQAFAELWDSINGERTDAAWVSNPLVTVISFRVHRCNVDDSARAGDQEDGGASPRPDGDDMRRSADE